MACRPVVLLFSFSPCLCVISSSTSTAASILVEVPVHDPLHAVDEAVASEVDEQADGQLQEPEVGEQLSLVNGRRAFGAFELDGHAALDQEVDAEAEFDFCPSVLEGHEELPLDAYPAAGELGGQEFLIGRFEEAGAEVGVDADRRVDDVGGDLVDRGLSGTSGRSVTDSSASCQPGT